MDYGNTKMHLYRRRRNVAAQVAEELDGHMHYPSYGGTQKERKKESRNHEERLVLSLWFTSVSLKVVLIRRKNKTAKIYDVSLSGFFSSSETAVAGTELVDKEAGRGCWSRDPQGLTSPGLRLI